MSYERCDCGEVNRWPCDLCGHCEDCCHCDEEDDDGGMAELDTWLSGRELGGEAGGA